jgi:preprotein translocase subunit SecF
MGIRALVAGDASNTDFIGRRRVWYVVSGLILTICVVSMIVRGFSFGIDFKGGAMFQFAARGHTTTEASSALSAVGISPDNSSVQELTTTSTRELRIQTPALTDAQTNGFTNEITKRFGVQEKNITISTVGASWGSTVTAKALQGLILFLVLVLVYLSIRFEWKMALAAMIALIHDLLVTAGVYSLVGFEVTPSTVIAVLTILGFSLYDTVVVFDRVRENTAGLLTTGRRTYAEATNDALNETLMRSINTSLIALIPVASLLFVGAGLLGAGTLKDLALAQFVGLASGAYSSLFVASPILVDLKKGEAPVRALDARVARARSRGGAGRAAAGSPAGGERGDRERGAREAGAREAGAREAGGDQTAPLSYPGDAESARAGRPGEAGTRGEDGDREPVPATARPGSGGQSGPARRPQQPRPRRNQRGGGRPSGKRRR